VRARQRQQPPLAAQPHGRGQAARKWPGHAAVRLADRGGGPRLRNPLRHRAVDTPAGERHGMDWAPAAAARNGRRLFRRQHGRGGGAQGGRRDLAMTDLPRVRAPTLLIVGGDDDEVLALNRQAHARLNTAKSLEVVPHATHLFEEPGALEQVAALAGDWFRKYLAAAATPP